QITDRKQLLGWWRQRARRTGLTRGRLDGCFGRAPLVFDRLPETWRQGLFGELLSPGGVTAQHSTFGRGHVIRWIAAWTVRGDTGDRLVVLPPDEALRLTDEFLALDQVVELAGRGRRSSDVIERSDGRRV